jgi:hypothetical protein
MGWEARTLAHLLKASWSERGQRPDLGFLITRRDRCCPLQSPTCQRGVYPSCTGGFAPVTDAFGGFGPSRSGDQIDRLDRDSVHLLSPVTLPERSSASLPIEAVTYGIA